MPRQSNDYMRKNVAFAKADPKEIELWEWLKRLPHGEFTEETKLYWMKRMESEGK